MLNNQQNIFSKFVILACKFYYFDVFNKQIFYGDLDNFQKNVGHNPKTSTTSDGTVDKVTKSLCKFLISFL